MPSSRNQFGNRVTNARAVREGHGGSKAYHPLEPPDLVVFPKSTEEVQEIVRVCASHVVPIVPFGAGTSLEGNASSPRGGVCLDKMKMNRVLAINTEDLDVFGAAWDHAQTAQFRAASHRTFFSDRSGR
jgi:D-lactate dehydrogenase (cytochrome)